MSVQEPVERELTLSHETYSTAKKALLYADDTTDDDIERYSNALADLVDVWNEATEAQRGDGDA